MTIKHLKNQIISEIEDCNTIQEIYDTLESWNDIDLRDNYNFKKQGNKK